MKPSLGNLAATSSVQRQEKIFERYHFILFWIVCLTGNCLYILLNPFIGDIWFNQSYKIPMLILSILVVNYYISIMVLPVESFRTANGLFVQGWYRPAIMAIMNIVLDYFLGREWGILGIFLATTISRTLTQVWYDPYLVYKHVFNKKPWSYYWKYFLYTTLTAVCCLVTGFITSKIVIDNKIFSFLAKAVVALTIPNIVIIVLFRKTENYNYVYDFVRKLKSKMIMKLS